MATKNNGLEKRTKAELIELVQRLTHSCNELEMQKERVKEDYNAVAMERAKQQELVLLLQEERNQQNSVNARLRDDLRDKARQLSAKETEFREMNEDRDSWKNACNAAKEERNEARKSFVRQAALSGEVAKLTHFYI